MLISRHASTQTKITWKLLKISLRKKRALGELHFTESTSSKIGPPPPGGPQKNREKMCKTYARHCIWDLSLKRDVPMSLWHSAIYFVREDTMDTWMAVQLK